MERKYVYRLRPLVLPGLAFLMLYPLVVGVFYALTKFPQLELKVLAGLYLACALALVSLWLFGKSKRIVISEERIVFASLFGRRVLRPEDVRRIQFFWDSRGRRFVQVRTCTGTYYLNDLYRGFSHLASDLEDFARIHGIRSNLGTKV